MTTKIKILIGVLILGLISGSVLFVLYILGIIPIAKPGPPILGQVSIFTDKREYEQDEIVEIIVRNTLDTSIWYNEETCPPFCVGLQKLENDKWKNINVAIKVISDLPVRASLLKPNEETNREWNMLIVENNKTEIAKSGKYRLSFNYGLSKDSFTEKTIYSNEFIIREMKKVVITTDKAEYKHREEIKITLINNLKKEITKGIISIERYNEKKEKWEDIEIGEFETEEQFKGFIKIYGPVASLEVLPEESSLTLSWIPITQEPISLEGEIFEIVAIGKHRIKVTIQDEIIYSNEFRIKEKEIVLDEKYCEKNIDCACGVHIETGECFYGNIKYVLPFPQCPDFCSGFGGDLRIRCVNNECKQVRIE